MLNPRWYKVIRDLWHNRLRTLLVVLAIAVGVFSFGVVGISQSILKDELNYAYRATHPASIQMTVSPFGNDLLDAVQNMREVADAEARATLTASLEIAPGEWITLTLTAFDDFDAAQISKVFLESGAWPSNPREVVLERSMLLIPGFDPGDTLHIELPDGRQTELVMAGIVHDVAQFPAQYFRLGIGYITLDTYQWLTDSRAATRLYIQVREDTDDQAAIKETAEVIKDRIERYGYTVFATNVPVPGEHWNATAMDSLLLVLGLLSVFSLVLTIFLIFNTMTAILKQQTRQIGMMKAIGGRAGQVIGVYLAMVLAFGLLALVVAVPAGALVARAFVGLFSSMNNFDIVHFRIEAWVLGLQAGLAVLLPLLAAILPVMEGTRVTVREALTYYGAGQTGSGGLIDRLMAHVRGLPRPLLLSLRNTFRRKGRLILTLLTLTLAGGFFIAIFSLRLSLQAMVNRVFNLLNYDLAIVLVEPIPVERLKRESLRVADVLYVEGWIASEARYTRPDGSEGAGLTVYGVPPDTPFVVPDLLEGHWLEAGGQHEIVIQRNLLDFEPVVAFGDQIKLDLGEQEGTWRIVGVMPYARDPDNDAGFAYVALDDLQRVVSLQGQATFAAIRTSAHDLNFQNRVLRLVEDRFKKAGIGISTGIPSAQLLATFDVVVTILMSMFFSIALLLALVGGLGLAGTMSLNVIERTREIGVLRSIGASNRSVFSIIVAEGVLIGLLSALLGAVVAIPLIRLLTVMLGQVMTGEPLPFAYSPMGVLVWLGLSLLLSAVASFLPARSAARLTVREILAYE